MRRFTFAWTAILIAAVSVTLLPAAVHAAPPIVFVDDSASPGGDGSAGDPLQTIQEGIALLGRRGGMVSIEPGTYLGPILVDRNDVVLWGNTTPIYDADGFLEGFTEEVVVTIDRKLDNGTLPRGTDVEDLIELRGSRNEVHNLVADFKKFGFTGFASAVSAKAEDDDFYDDVVFSHLIVRGFHDTSIWTRKANATIEYVTSLSVAYVGLSPTGSGQVDIRRADLAKKGAAVCFLGLFEAPRDENGPSLLTGSVRDSRLTGPTGALGFADHWGVLVINIGGDTNFQEPSIILVEVTRNVFEGLRDGIYLRPMDPKRPFNAPVLTEILAAGNTYHRTQRAISVDFESLSSPKEFVQDATVIVIDGDGVAPAEADVDLGPAENGNDYELLD
jgi:hypothetical protein